MKKFFLFLQLKEKISKVIAKKFQVHYFII